MPKLMTVGEILVEIMAEELGQPFTRIGKYSGPYPSGAPAICIDQAARLGASCGIVACVGEDAFGAMNIARLKDDGVDVSQIRRLKGKTTGAAFVTYDANGDRNFIFHFTDAAAGALTPMHIKPGQFKGCKILHIMGCSLSASFSLREAILKAVRICKGLGAKISFDPNIRPELLDVSEIKDTFHYIMSNADILLTGENELSQLLDCDIDSVITALRERGIKIIALKSASKGSRVITADIDEIVPAYTAVEVDPTGAGDCFDGAFLATLLDGGSALDAARTGNAAGANNVTKKGPMEGAATRKDIERILSGGRQHEHKK